MLIRSYLAFSAAFCLSFLARGQEFLSTQDWTTEDDHQNMLQQLGITELRHGADGWAKAGEADAANYDESQATPYPELPDLLVRDNGEPVNSRSIWWIQRRPEIAAHFENEVYGKIPDGVPEVSWKVAEEREDGTVGGVPVVSKRLVGLVDNSAAPSIEVELSMTLVVPKEAKGPVPVLVMFHPLDWPLPEPEGLVIPKSRWPQPETDVPPSPVTLIQEGWAYVYLNTQRIQPDNGAGLTKGIIGLTNKGQPRTPEQWGALRAWGWGASRALDYLETEPLVDITKAGIEGVSRNGKAALVTLAFEPRFAMGLIGSSGKGGATLYRRNYGEKVENLTGGGGYHWMAGNYLKYSAEASRFGRMDANDLPVDSHQLIAMCAPRLTFISYGIPESGDAHWLDQRGSYMATVAAEPAFELLGASGIGGEGDYLHAEMPPVEKGLLEGELAWRQHSGGHEDRSNMKTFIQWAKAHWEE